MKFLKRLLTVLLCLVIWLTAVFFAGRYGWVLAGFRACTGAGISSIEVGDREVTITGFYPYSFPTGFCGCYSREEDGTLYVGFRFSAVFGLFETGDFTVTIPVEGDIRKVVLKTKNMEATLWELPESNG